jgi:hypothetical protein
MTPGKYDLNLYRGDSYTWQFTLWQDTAATVPVDLAGAEPAAEIRNTSAGTIYTTLVATVTAPNIVTLDLSAPECENCPAKGVWDLQLTFPNGDVRTVVAGAVTTTGDVTDSVAAPATVSGRRYE